MPRDDISAVLPTAARRARKGTGCGRAINSVGIDLGGRIIAVPEVLEGLERLGREILGIEIVKVIRIAASVGPRPPIVLESTLPVAVVAGINGTPSFVIRLSRLGSKTDAALAFGVPLVQEELLGRATIGRVQGDVVVLTLSSIEECSRCATLQIRLTRRGAVNGTGVSA